MNLQKLNWDLAPITSNNWLNTYLQLAQDVPQEELPNGDGKPDDQSFVFPRYSPLTFVQVSKR